MCMCMCMYIYLIFCVHLHASSSTFTPTLTHIYIHIGEPLYSSHMLDLSEEVDEENIETCVSYYKRLTAINCFLEMEIGSIYR